MSKPSLYLASQSPRRRELLQQIGVCFAVIDAPIEECRQADESPQAYATRLAAEKALAGQRHVGPSVPVMGADTIVVVGDTVLEKPHNQTHAAEMMQLLSGRTHQVMSSVSICCGDRQQTRLSVTEVTFRELTRPEIERYWQTGEPVGKAGGYAVQGFGALFVTGLKGSYSGVVGLALEEVYRLLKQFEIPFWQNMSEQGL